MNGTFFIGQLKSSWKGGGGVSFRRVVWHGNLVHISLSCFPHPGFPHSSMGVVLGLCFIHADMVQRRYACLVKVSNCDEF